MSTPIEVQKNPDGSWTAKGGLSLTVVTVTAVTEHKAVAGHAAAMRAIQQKDQGWIKCSDRLPESGVTVLVYTPPQPGDYPDDVRISFDSICPEADGDYWLDHGEHYDQFIALGGHRMCGPDTPVIGPAEAAPYTHWMPMPSIPTK